MLFLVLVHRGIPLDIIIILIIIETLNYANIISRIDELFITSICETSKIRHFIPETTYLIPGCVFRT